jgi:hypothetical protein
MQLGAQILRMVAAAGSTSQLCFQSYCREEMPGNPGKG